MITLSTRTLGHVIQLAMVMTKSDIRDLLMQSGIYDATGGDTADLVDRGTASPNKSETLRKPLLQAHDMATRGDRKAHEALLEVVRIGAERTVRHHYGRKGVVAYYDEDGKLSSLREALLVDGYELRLRASDWDVWTLQLSPVDLDAIPINIEITALEAELASRHYTEAREHYRSAVKHFIEQEYSSANGQLRNMVESLIVNLAGDHACYTDTGKSNQGGRAIKALYVQGGRPPAVIGSPLPERDGGGMLQGIWDILHSNGPHPGLSDADEVRLRVHLCTGLARFLLKHFPVKS